MRSRTLGAVISVTVIFVFSAALVIFKQRSMPTPPPRLGAAPTAPAPHPAAKLASGGPVRLRHWDDFLVQADFLPPQSYYRVSKQTDTELEVVFYPNIGSHEFQGPYDFYITVAVRRAPDPTLQSAFTPPYFCTSATGPDDSLSPETIGVGPFTIVIDSDVHYRYPSDAPGSNPNPYTSEVDNILSRVWRGLKFGPCGDVLGVLKVK